MMEGWMYGYSPVHWFWFILIVAVIIYPVGRILGRIGFSPLWSILVFLPFLNLIGLWMLAFTEWPEKRAN